MTSLPPNLAKLRDEMAEALTDVDKVNSRFFSPFQGMEQMYALQKGLEEGFNIGFAACYSLMEQESERLRTAYWQWQNEEIDEKAFLNVVSNLAEESTRKALEGK